MACPYGDSFTPSAAVGHNLWALTGLGKRERCVHLCVCMRQTFGVVSATPYEATTWENNVAATPASSSAGTPSRGPVG
jgi:hypothetical protein